MELSTLLGFRATHTEEAPTQTFILLGSDEKHKSTLANRLTGQHLSIDPADAKSCLRGVSSISKDPPVSCIVVGSSDAYRTSFLQLRAGVQGGQIHIVLCLTFASVSKCITDCKEWLEALKSYKMENPLASVTILLTELDRLQDQEPQIRKIAFGCIRAMGLFYGPILVPSDSTPTMTICTVSDSADLLVIQKHLLALAGTRRDPESLDTLPYKIDDYGAILHIPPGSDSSASITGSPSAEEALRTVWDSFKKHLYESQTKDAEVHKLEDYLEMVTIRTKTDDAEINDLLQGMLQAREFQHV
ncbi:hypothetical protein GMRT_15882 [Giardia muris]|uniref:Cytoplasmic dynein 2 light intermediate chain 1 n=1 Tax=Giardia muris TaxID=5742 RepID=A0A4Z1SWI3_GIAMU|nr:hypothetical protein GMRT_15882 [Giardia muris]|eukprot:TNJ29930.1 hypothetical protein GMRT_15882 [Giardia muris]